MSRFADWWLVLFGSSEPRIPPPDPRVESWLNSDLPEVSKENLRRRVFQLLGPHNRLHSADAMEKTEELKPYFALSYEYVKTLKAKPTTRKK